MNVKNNYMETDLGNVAPNPRGEFSEAEEYEYLDYVYYQGGSYLCLAELGTTIVGFAPEPGNTTQYWQAVALPGGLTKEYTDMHDRVVNLSEQVEADAEEVRKSKENIEGMETNVGSIQAQVAENAQDAEASKTQAAGYANAAEISRQAAAESEANVNAKVTGFDEHVAEKTSSAENEIEAARIAANKSVLAQQEESVQAVKNETEAYIDEKKRAAEQAIEQKATDYSTSVDADIQSVMNAGSAQVNAVNTAGENQKKGVNDAGDAKVKEVNSTGEAQKKAIEDAVQEVLNNIGNGLDSSLTKEGKAADAGATGAAINELKSDLDELINKEFEVESTGYINDDLNIVQSLGWNITKPIMVYKNVKYFFKSINYTAVSAITECLEDGTLLRVLELGQFIDDDTPTTISFTPSNDTYVKLSYKNNYLPHFYTMYKIEDLERYSFITLDNESIIKQNITENIGMNRFNQNSSVRGFISQDGKTINVHEDWMTTDYIHVNNMKQVYISADYNGEQIPLKAFFFTIYDENKEVIYRFDEMETPYTIIDRVHYIRFSYHDNITNLMVTDGSTTPLDYSSYNAKNVIGNKVWQNKKWCTIGDSLTQHNERTRFNYHDYVSKNTGIEVINLGSSGKGYMAGGSEDAFYHIALSVPCDSDVVTIFGSGNDLSHGYELGEITDTGTSTICGCINTTIDTIISRLPRVSLGIVTPTPWEDYPPNVKNNLMEEYSNAIIEICRNRSIPCLDLYHESNLRPWTEEGRMACYSNDGGGGVHPDEYGHKLIAPRFKAFLETLII